ncbi:MAG TPA: hypothetical protein VNV44_10840 [Solirubrobacteraceae bacterium]|jgi:hypothetical protein|nr:hypothetical protein [Solirubrobacteraceae bacterium]
MATFHFKQITTATPEQFVAALTDFGPGRKEIFANSSDSDLVVYDRGPDWADVKEGSAGVWERLHYDWSDPDHVILTTTDSNTWGGASSHTYTLTRKPNGMTEIDYVVVRDGKNLRGRALELLARTVGRGTIEKAFAGAVKAIEARSAASKPAGVA